MMTNGFLLLILSHSSCTYERCSKYRHLKRLTVPQARFFRDSASVAAGMPDAPLARLIRAALLSLFTMVAVTCFWPIHGSDASTDSESPVNIDLNQWQLTLPVNSAGQLSGKAAVERPATLVAPWLTRMADGGLSFWAPAGGATTPHSLHSRTELD
jgi:hypothetical protein